ncbi:Tn7-like transposition protein D [Tolypothrix sp. NIES-4075]|uniref:TnsD family Tn7-like transposition protein n=1 Tax=Tolypothrix sp. NIES-4075 TaxID=2005459 RepID=UPI000B5C9A28|nr:TnsD family Tn7-like transposition protein [Tolypothrix sp. NIES-4075]GAX45296.1 Tn7-like transposition protein D [Tolypothrix sp. NIES-4075]
MIPCFPTPLPDELLYSVCARYSERMQYSDKQFLNRELFGDKNIATVVDLPSHLSHLLSILPLGHGYTVDRLIDEHTLLPFYSPFLPLERVNRIREHMIGVGGSAIHNWSGVTPSTIRRPNWLRFCPLCVQEDDLQYGEPYWRRLHQLPGVEVCPVHHVFLESSLAPARNHSNSSEYFSAQQAILQTTPRSLDLSNQNQGVLLSIARDAATLLGQRGLVPGFDSLRNRYIKLLADRKLAIYTGLVRVSKLVKEFKEYYSSELLIGLQCEVNENKRSNWLSQLVKSLNCNKVNHPLRHLLLIQFLGYTVEEWNKLPNHLNFFGSGPWPCLNPTCSDFRQPCIQECLIRYQHDHGGRLTGTFCCSCGFIYTRTGPDVLPEDLLRIDIIEKYGTVWEEALRQKWSDSTLSQREIARLLGVSGKDTIKRQAVRLNLQFPRTGPTGKLTQIKEQQRYRFRNAREIFLDNLESYRREWLNAIEEHPSGTRTFLSRKYHYLYNHLRAYDVEWLKAHLPPPNAYRRVGSARSVDWSSRDAELAIAVRLSARSIKSTLGHPVRVTRGAIGRDLDRKPLLDQYLHKLPLTAKALAQVVETYEEFAIRRIQWAAECFRQENIHPTRSQLVCRASMKPKIAAASLVQVAIETALASFDPINVGKTEEAFK